MRWTPLWALPLLVPLTVALVPTLAPPVATLDDLAPQVEAPPATPAPPSATEDAAQPLQGFTQDAHGRLLQGIIEDQGPGVLIARFSDYYRDAGFHVPPSNPSHFDENSTISFSYEVGDVDGDGTDDVALDTFCVAFDGCRPVTPLNLQNLGGFTSGTLCGVPHGLLVLSGADGRTLWNRSLDRPHAVPFYACALEFVVGVLPIDEGRPGILVYRLMVLANSRFEHEISLLHAGSGDPAWTFREEGSVLRLGQYVRAENVLINPILQVRQGPGLAHVSPETRPALFLQGVGFEASFANTVVAPPTESSPAILVNSYQPDEWAARLEPATGGVAWRVPTFGPQGARSVRPAALQVASIVPTVPSDGAAVKASYYWAHVPCCFDQTGDHVPDLVYTTMEWSSYPNTNLEGPYGRASRIVLFEGDRGGRVYDRYVEEGTDVDIFSVRVRLLGDANGDGAGDLIHEAVYNDFDFVAVTTIRNGPDGAEIWRRETPRLVQPIVLGDADRDGGNDVLFLEWLPNGYVFANVTATPLALRSGRDGHELWTATTYTAPTDLLPLFQNARLNGLPDLDADGVGDVPVDDPVFLPDLTAVHRQTYLSGRDGHRLFRFLTVGSLSFPNRAGDATGDGRDDLVVLNGDLNDLWITTIDGATGHALWSRRLLAARLTEEVHLDPRIRVHALAGPDATHDVLLNFQLVTRSTNPQIAAFEGFNGSAAWALPRFWDPRLSVVVPGASPASKVYADYFEPVPVAATVTAQHVGLTGLLALGVFGGAFGLGLFLATRRWRR